MRRVSEVAAASPVDRLRRRAAALRARLEAEVRNFDLPLCLVHERMLLAQSELDVQADAGDKNSRPVSAGAGEGRPGGDPPPPVGARERALSSPGRSAPDASWVVVSPPGTVLEDIDWSELVQTVGRLRACEGVQIDATGITLRLRREPTAADLAWVRRCWRSAGGDDTEWQVQPSRRTDSDSPAGRRGEGSW